MNSKSSLSFRMTFRTFLNSLVSDLNFSNFSPYPVSVGVFFSSITLAFFIALSLNVAQREQGENPLERMKSTKQSSISSSSSRSPTPQKCTWKCISFAEIILQVRHFSNSSTDFPSHIFSDIRARESRYVAA